MSDIVGNMTRGWNQKPTGVLTGARSAFTAALWEQRIDEPVEVRSVINPNHYILSAQMSRFDVEMFIDDRHLYSKHHAVGDMQLTRPGEQPRAVLGTTYRVMHFYLPRLLVETVARDAFSSDGGVELIDPRGERDDFALGIARRLEREAQSGSALSPLCADALGLDLIVHLLRRWSNRRVAENGAPVRGGLAPWQLRRSQEAMLSQIDADLGLDDLAAVAGCSSTHFSRAFKQSTGVAPFYWLAAQRIEKAKELLADPRLSLAEISLAVGFSAQPHFTTAFRRATGTTPGQWRRERLL
jgi:AraC-like DNA-binding protein